MTDDFWLRWNKNTLTGLDFNYASASLSGIWSSTNFTEFSVTSGASVPEPASVMLFSLGLIGLGFGVRKKA